MKNKNVAALLALFIGSFGIHRFYLGQTGLGIFYILLSITGISAILGIIDFIAFLSMDEQVFDAKYNRNRMYRRDGERQYDTDFDRPRRGSRGRETKREYREERREYREERKEYERPESRYEKERRPVRRSKPKRAKTNPYKVSGLERYRDFEFEAAIADFKKALKIDANDIAVHFNMACAYSLTEDKDSAFFHLSRAVELGFVDYEKIQSHDALAFLRIQDEFDDFARKGYRLTAAPDPSSTVISKEEDLANTSDLLEQLKKLGALREKGLLTDQEFQIQKRKLLG